MMMAGIAAVGFSAREVVHATTSLTTFCTAFRPYQSLLPTP
ncbi:hypothetical protein [Methylovorus sp. MP688]|nr:hypothetical protein [Methylovorus sp. MP688]